MDSKWQEIVPKARNLNAVHGANMLMGNVGPRAGPIEWGFIAHGLSSLILNVE